jgi:hypothetical protein
MSLRRAFVAHEAEPELDTYDQMVPGERRREW